MPSVARTGKPRPPRRRRVREDPGVGQGFHGRDGRVPDGTLTLQRSATEVAMSNEYDVIVVGVHPVEDAAAARRGGAWRTRTRPAAHLADNVQTYREDPLPCAPTSPPAARSPTTSCPII